MEITRSAVVGAPIVSQVAYRPVGNSHHVIDADGEDDIVEAGLFTLDKGSGWPVEMTIDAAPMWNW